MLALCPAPLAAQQRVPDSPEPQQIIVTGERIPRDRLETNSSVAVLTDEAIEATGADRLDQLLALIPNVQLGSGEEGPAIRGQDSTGQLRNLFAFLGGARPRVTLQVDGRPVSFYEFISGAEAVWDVAKVEVFRSPQTTTQGRNSIAGAIFVETQDPTYDREGRGRLIVGDFRTRQASAMVSGPLVPDELAFRIAGDIRTSRIASDLTDGIPQADINRDDYGFARVKLLYEPQALAGARLETTYAHTESQAPQFEGVTAPFRARSVPVPDRTIGIMKVRADSLTGRGEYDFTPALQTSFTLSLGKARLLRFGLPGLGNTRADTNDFSGEATAIWRPGPGFQLLAGLHRLSNDQNQTIDITGLGIGNGNFVDRQDSLGLFGEATWRPGPHVALTGGLRFQQDRQERHGSVGPIVLDYDETFDALLPKLALTYGRDDRFSAGILVQRAFNPGGTSLSLARRAEDRFGAERLWNYEVFARASLAGGKAFVSANAFYNDIANAQRPQTVPIVLPNGVPLFASEFDNAPRAESYGLEAEFTWRPSRRLALAAGIGLLRTEVIETVVASDPTRGKDFQRSPDFSAAGSIDWRPLESLRLSAQLRHQSGYFSDDANLAARRIEASTILDTRAAYSAGRITLFGYARNLLDEFYLTYLFSPTFGSAGDPRELGIGVEARF